MMIEKRKRPPIDYTELVSPFKKAKITSNTFTPITSRKIRAIKRSDDKNLPECQDTNSFKTPQEIGFVLEQLLSGTQCFNNSCKNTLELCAPGTPVIDLFCSACGRVYQVKSSSSNLFVYFNEEYIHTGSKIQGQQVLGVPSNQILDLKTIPIFICIRLDNKNEDYYIDNKKSYVLIPELISTSDMHYMYLSDKPSDTRITWNSNLVKKEKLSKYVNIQKLQKKIN